LAAVGGAAEGIYIARLWRFLTNMDVKVSVITDSSSCRAFSERQGVGRLKHIDTKAPLEPVVLPGSPPPETDEEELPEIPRIGINWEDMDLLMEQLPRGQRRRAERIRGVSLFAEQSLREFLLVHMMILYPNQPGLNYDLPHGWSRQEQHEYQVFRDIVVDGRCQDCWGSFCEKWFIHSDHGHPRNYGNN